MKVQIEMIYNDNYYIDWSIWRKATHDLTLTYDKENKCFWSQVRISKTPQDQFGDPRMLPDTITQKLVTLIK